MSAPAIRIAVRCLRAHYPETATADALARLTLITDGKEVYLLTDERQVMNVVTRQWVWSVPLGLLITEATQKVGLLPQEWTEQIAVGRQSFRLMMSEDPDRSGYVVECRELPGFIHRVQAPADAVAAAKEAIASLLSLRERRQRRASAVSGEAVA